MNRSILLCAALASLIACGAEGSTQEPPVTQPEPEPAACSQAPDNVPCDAGTCDDGNPCTTDERGVDGCVNTALPDHDPCSLADEPGVCVGGACVPRAGCDAQETKCQSPTINAGWCGTWQWPASDALYCRSCVEITCLGIPGCSPVGDVCQDSDGSGGCPPGCCPICY